ncbi:MAG: DUF4297 family anti-phage-associated protein [Chitinophagales bacterium]
MADRTAIDTIRGYFYQFDYSIASLLALPNDNNSIVIEGVEDVDVKIDTEETAVQCKYYAKSEYNHSVIAEPIRLMLDHFKEVKLKIKPKLNYKLRGHYKSGQNKLVLPIDVSYLKEHFLTYTRSEKVKGVMTKVKHYHHTELGLDDADLANFLAVLEIDIHAKEFEKQYSDILVELKNKFNCSAFAAEYLFYNNALGIIRKISKEADLKDRRITKKSFLKKIDTSRILFNEWFIKIKGEKAHFDKLRKEYFGNLNVLYKERFFLFEINTSTYSRDDIKEVLSLAIKNYTKIINQPNPFCPYVYMHGIEESELVEIKKDLIADGIIINDGFDFSGAVFNPQSLVRKPSLAYPIKIKFVNNLDSLNATLALTGRRSELYQFYQTNSFFDYNNLSVKQVKIQINQIKNIKNII